MTQTATLLLANEAFEPPAVPARVAGAASDAHARARKSQSIKKLSVVGEGEKGKGRTLPRVKKKKKAKAKAKAAKKPKFDVGTSRGIESMLRNSYRAQLAMIALAARKANIMISVNGFLLSLLTLGSAYILTTEPLLLIPSGIFFLTCVTAILFAVLAARPHKVDKSKTRKQDFRKDRADLLVFEQFSNLSKEDHMSTMLEMMADKERVYRSMVAHLHFLGSSANRRFKTLQISYNAFIIGLIASCISLLVISVSFYL